MRELKRAALSAKTRVLNNGGNYGAIAGVITNFQWSVNDNGGFDCTTDIITHGTAMLESSTGEGAPTVAVPEDEEEE